MGENASHRYLYLFSLWKPGLPCKRQRAAATTQHCTCIPHGGYPYRTQRMRSIYMKNADNIFAQIAIGSDPIIHANFELEQGVLKTKHANAQSSIVPAGNGWYRCSMITTSTLGISFLLYLTTYRLERCPGARKYKQHRLRYSFVSRIWNSAQ